MDVSITENKTKTRQLLTESFSGVWSISYKTNTNFTIDYTGNIYGPMRLPLLGENDPRAEFSPWFSVQNIQLTKKIGPSWEVYGGIKNLLNYTPPANSINSSNNPFDEGIDTDKNPELAFDPSYVFASNQGIRTFVGLRYTLF
jgi:outer membrane receptor for ferrienterochelin and colicins